MPRLGVDPDYRFGDDLSLSSGLRSRSRSPLTYVGYTSKEEQEWQDHQLALRLQEEADRERQAVVEDTLDPEQIEAILGTSFDLPSRRNEPDSSDDVIILSETSSPSSLTRSNTPAQPALSRADREMYDGELTLLSEGENTEEDDSEDDDSPGEDVEESESDDNQVEEQSDDSEVEEMDDSEDDDDEAPNNDEDQESESSDSDSSDSDDEHDRLGLFRRILVQRNLDSLDSDDDEDRLSPELLSQILRETTYINTRKSDESSVLEGVEVTKPWSWEAERSKLCWLPATAATLANESRLVNGSTPQFGSADCYGPRPRKRV
ncbi:hypothetical protein Y032_0020g123 [Ancylostoma ceylanicum]|uniref:Uncharacterized protein n=1 Tax=Ancylostoma ceylanicum TaxID=53326 RepID=A0A016V0C1_9BILA|nr:hypothetical protein Y032_0020g123 [Ancylostoma ceylanicum]